MAKLDSSDFNRTARSTAVSSASTYSRGVHVAHGIDKSILTRLDQIKARADTVTNGDCAAAQHRLVNHHPERLVLRGEHQKVGSAIDCRPSGAPLGVRADRGGDR